MHSTYSLSRVFEKHISNLIFILAAAKNMIVNVITINKPFWVSITKHFC
jgi:hypothetical protein